MPAESSRVKQIFADAAELHPAERRAFLDQHIGPDEAGVRDEVESLLAAHDRMGEFLAPGSAAPGQHPILAEGITLNGRYRIIRLLGRGGSGEVYEAYDEELSVFVALKVLIGDVLADGAKESADRQRFRREILVARRTSHPNLCQVFDYHRDTGDPPGSSATIEYISMERLAGETLAARVERGPVPEAEARGLMAQICAGVAAAHRAGIVHRDLKPGNIMLCPAVDAAEEDGVRAVVMDFGIAREIRPGAAEQLRTATGQLLGTPAYISPEQLRNEATTPATDVYALGLILYEMLTGVRPFASGDGDAGAWRRLTDKPEPVWKLNRAVSRQLGEVVAKCLAVDPAGRYASAADVLAAMSAPGGASERRKMWLAAAAAIVLAVGGWLALHRAALGQTGLPAEKHLAVLPFTTTGREAVDPAFADGIAGALTAELARQAGAERHFWVAPFSDVLRFAVKEPAAAKAVLGANLVLAGQLESAGGGFAASVRLLDPATAREVRAQRVTVPAGEGSRMTELLSAAVSGLLELPQAAGPGAAEAAMTEGSAPGAFSFYLQGVGYLGRSGAESATKAAAMFQKAVAADRNYSAAWAGLARADLNGFNATADPKWLDEAEPAVAQALQLDPDRGQVYLSRGMIDYYRGRFTEAIPQFEAALAHDASLADAVTMLARSQESLGQLLQAEALFQRVIAMEPGYWMHYNDLGLLYYRNNQFEKAEPLFRTVTAMAPDNPLGFSNLGGVLLAEDKYGEAQTVLERARVLRPGPGVYSNLGTVLYRQKRYAESAAVFQKAVELAPKDSRMWRNLAEAQQRGGDAGVKSTWQECAREARVQLDHGAASPMVLTTAAICEARTGEMAQARSDIEKALVRYPSDSEVGFQSAIVFAEAGDQKRALDQLDRIFTAGYPKRIVLDEDELSPLRSSPRFQKWVAESNLR